MRTYQWESRFIMIKRTNSFYSMERFFGMALFTILPKSVLVRIFVAGIAIGKFESSELLNRFAINNLSFVTFFARHSFVFAKQWKSGGVMIKITYFLK